MKATFTLAFLCLLLLISCQQNSSKTLPEIKKGMIKMAIYYPNAEGKTFDMEYYSKTHMPMASNLLGDALKAMIIDKGISGRTPDMRAPNIAIGYFYFDDMAAFRNAMGPNSEKLRADVPNFTNIQPVIQISEVQAVRLQE